MLHSMKNFRFGTKAETLESLVSLISKSHIPRFCYFNVDEWVRNRESILGKIQSDFPDDKIIIRSSAYGEDHTTASMAGFFNSISNVASNNRDSVNIAIDKVIESYKKLRNENEQKENQVLVQLMIEDISMSGVVFTQDLNTGAPYYVINYDDETGRTDTVTAGSENSNRTLLVHRDSVDELKSERFKALLHVVQEIEKATGHDALDIEFAVDKNNKVHLFQVRPIATKPNWNRGITLKINDAIGRMKSFVEQYQKPVSGLYGVKSIFGTMPDWNPAEMIGTSPRPLALSLYRYLITDFAWREARKQMGYMEIKGGRLMIDLCGKPYIDVRLSFNSFLPGGLNPPICSKLVDAWLKRLGDHKELHDKIEFDIVTTTLAFDFESSVEKQFPGVLDEQELGVYKKALFKLTDNLLSSRIASIDGELEKIEMLAERRKSLMNAFDKPSLAVVASLLEDCIYLGTIPFSILARHAFIATSFLRSLVSRGIVNELEVSLFKKSIKTITSDFITDINNLTVGKVDIAGFMGKYGHLRPGTYDILSRRYDQREDLLKTNLKPKMRTEDDGDYSFTPLQIDKIESLLKEFGYKVTVERFLKYIKDAIAAREYSKFIFTKNVSDALEIIAEWGESVGLNRDELSYLNIVDILDTINVAKGRGVEHSLRELSRKGKESHEIALAVRLPYLIEGVEDVSIVPLLIAKPNFITNKTARGEYVFVDAKATEIPNIDNKIVLIEGADPGFDWIFARPIKGLITKFGGANSHMAIRCAEFGLPAAIGCGEQIFDRILRSGEVELNCSEERICV